jgi:hypothetical protein
VKLLIEGGTFLHRPLLLAVLQHLQQLTSDCAMEKYNPHLLPLLVFLHKCTGVGQEGFWGLVEQHQLRHILLPAAGSQGGAAAAKAAASSAASAASERHEALGGAGQLGGAQEGGGRAEAGRRRPQLRSWESADRGEGCRGSVSSSSSSDGGAVRAAGEGLLDGRPGSATISAQASR